MDHWLLSLNLMVPGSIPIKDKSIFSVELIKLPICLLSLPPGYNWLHHCFFLKLKLQL